MRIVAVACALLALLAAPAQAEPLPAAGSVEVAFTPWDDAEGAIVRVLGKARESIHVQAYLLTSRSIAKALQELGKFDTKTSSWLNTPAEIRKLGGAIFGDRRYERVFVYHNGAESYYGARGFRGALKV